MTVLFDINHPAHVHYFKNTIIKLEKSGHKVFVVSRNKEIEHSLLKAYGISFISRGKGASNFLGRIFYHLYAVSLLIFVIVSKRVDLIVSFMHPYAAQASYLTRKKAIVFSDTENANWHHKFTVPFANEIHTGNHFKIDYGEKHHRFSGFMELAYLYPDSFKFNLDIKKKISLKENQKLIVLRFISRKSVHDFGHPGLNESEKERLINGLLKLGKVLISSEVPLPREFEDLRIQVPPHEIHSLLNFADLFVGESATMAAESALLGVPSIYIDNTGRGYIDWIQKHYNHLFRFEESLEGIDNSLKKSGIILSRKHDKDSIRKKIRQQFSDHSDYIISQVYKNLGKI